MKLNIKNSFTIFIVCLFVMNVFFSSCNEKPSEEQTKNTIVIGHSQIGAESSWRTCSTRSILNSAQKSGIEVMFDDAEQEQDNQIKAIRSFIAYRVDVIVVSPMTQANWDNVLLEAKSAGIPVILVDRGIDSHEDLFNCYIGSDFIKEGNLAAEYLKKKFKYKTKNDINIVEISGVEDSTPAIGRSKGFKEGIKDNKNFKIVFSESGNFMRSRGKEIMKKVLDKNIDVDVLFSHNDAMTMGALEAIREKGLRPGRDIVIISFDGEQEAMDELILGNINCVVECTPYLGDSIIEAVLKLTSQEEVPKYIYSEERVFTEFDKDLKDLPPREY